LVSYNVVVESDNVFVEMWLYTSNF
jgi:hypothetical protein